jgi:hypothetical protein
MRGGAVMWSRYGNIPDSYKEGFMNLIKQTLRKEFVIEKTLEISDNTTKDEIKNLIKNSSDFTQYPESVKTLFERFYGSEDWN